MQLRIVIKWPYDFSSIKVVKLVFSNSSLNLFAKLPRQRPQHPQWIFFSVVTAFFLFIFKLLLYRKNTKMKY